MAGGQWSEFSGQSSVARGQGSDQEAAARHSFSDSFSDLLELLFL